MDSTSSLMTFPPQLDVLSGETRSSVYKSNQQVPLWWDPAGGLGVAAYQAAYSVAGLGPLSEPVLHPVVLELHCCGLFERIVCPDDLHETTVARPRLLRHYHTIIWMLLLADSGKA